MNAPKDVRVSISTAHKIVNARDVYERITSPEPVLHGHMRASQAGGIVYVTLDDGRDALVPREAVAVESP